MQEIRETRHIREEMWIALENDTILPEQYMQILEHTCQCTGCADRLATVMNPTLPPSYLEEQILERVSQVDIQAAVTVKQTTRKMQLILYSLRVGAAVLASIFILAATAGFRDTDFAKIEQVPYSNNQTDKDVQQKETVLDKVNQAANGLTERMNEITNQILNGGKKK